MQDIDGLEIVANPVERRPPTPAVATGHRASYTGASKASRTCGGMPHTATRLHRE